MYFVNKITILKVQRNTIHWLHHVVSSLLVIKAVIFSSIKGLKSEEWYNEQTNKKKTKNYSKKQTKLLQRKNKGLVADYRNVNAIIELNFQGMAHILKKLFQHSSLIKLNRKGGFVVLLMEDSSLENYTVLIFDQLK